MQTLPTEVALTSEQQEAIEYVLDNLQKGLVAIAGPAGSGKTTLIRELAAMLRGSFNVTITATTNKAAVVLRRKGIEAVTFHQACMRPLFRPPMDKLAAFLEQALSIEDRTKMNYPKSLVDQFGMEMLESALDTIKESGIYAAFRKLGIKDIFKYIESWFPAPPATGVLIIDEASMLGQTELANAREVYSKIILVGDEFQLPPVKSEAVFWSVKDRVALTHIHRQAEGSQPLTLATAIRENRFYDVKVETIDLELCRAGMPVIVWRNKTREQLTTDIRSKLGYGGQGPQVGEVLICRNASDRAAKQRGLINNSLWTVTAAAGYCCTLENDAGEVMENEEVHIEELGKGMGVPFRFGYVLTAHNSQGSEWETVQVHQPDAHAFMGFNRPDAIRWLYTAVTRAKERVIWVSSKIA